jgi:hypothetical protein
MIHNELPILRSKKATKTQEKSEKKDRLKYGTERLIAMPNLEKDVKQATPYRTYIS